MKQFFIVITSILIVSMNASGQFSLNMEVSALYDDNLFRSPYIYEDLLTDFDTRITYQFHDKSLGIYYNPEFIQYRDFSERNFSIHTLGINYYNQFGSDKQYTFFTGSNFLMRINRNDFDLYNYNQFYAYASMRLDLGVLFLKTGYNFRYRTYLDSDYSNLTNYRHNIFLQVNKSLPSRTSFILEGKIGNKSFNGIRIYTTYRDGANPPDDGGGGRGRGHSENNLLTVSKISDITSISAADVTTIEPSDLTQFILITRIAQSIMTRMGIYFQYRKQISLTDETTYFNSDAYFQDEELFDDPFSYESNDFSSQLTWMLPGLFKVRAGGGITSKKYISEQAYVSATDSIATGDFRSDDSNSFYLSVSKIVRVKKSWLYSLIFELGYNYLRNESNSFWYNYKNSFYSFSINWNL